MIESALDYIRRGWPVFPICAHGKMPLIPKDEGGQGHHDATLDEKTVRGWWGRWPGANIGLVCSERSGFFVLDVDPKNGGQEALTALQQEHGRLPTTIAAHTGSNGWHIYFRHDPAIGNSASKIAKGIDTRGNDQGYVVAPPSIHPNGTAYRWAKDHGPDEAPIVEAPAWIVEALRKPEITVGAAPDTWRDLYAQGCGEGNRNNAVARMAGYFLRKKIDPYLVLDLVRCWNRDRVNPPLPDGEIETIINSIAGKELTRIQKRRG